MSYLQLATQTELIRIPFRELLCIIAEGNYARLKLCNGKDYLVASNLAFIEDALKDQFSKEEAGHFIRIGRSLIVRIEAVCYINTIRGELHLLHQSQDEPILQLKVAISSLKQFKLLLQRDD